MHEGIHFRIKLQFQLQYIYRRGVQIFRTTLWRTMVVSFMELALAASSWAETGPELITLALEHTLLMQDVIK